MGRKKIYQSKKEKNEAIKKTKREWYRRNNKHVRDYRVEKYWREKL